MTECPTCGSDTYPMLGRCVTCTNPDCKRYNIGWDPTKESE
jgi:hypothetical protein